MTWDSFHRRGDVLRAVTHEVNTRCDGNLPMDFPGVAETFADEIDLLGSLQLRWFTMLSGHIDRLMVEEPLDLERAVVEAWQAAATALPGVRAVLDAVRETPETDEFAQAIAVATAKEHQMMALMAGRASQFDVDERAARVGALIEAKARTGLVLVPAPRERGSFLDRLKARLAA